MEKKHLTSNENTESSELQEAKKSPEKTEKTNHSRKTSDTPEKKRSLTRKGKHTLLSSGITLLVIAAVVLLNIIATTLTEKVPGLTADITALKSFQLDEQSISIAEHMDKKVEITFLSEKNTYIELDPYCKQTAYVAEGLSRYSGGNISVRYLDLVKNPTFADNFKDKELASTDVVITCGENHQILSASDLYHFDYYYGNYQYIVSSQSEQMIDNAIVNVSSEEITNTVIITDNCAEDYSYFKSMLNNNGYKVTELSLVSETIPEDTDLVIIYAPTRDYSENAVQRLRDFLNNNGKYGKNLLFASDSQDADLPNLDKLLDEYGMKIEHSLAFETDTTRIVNGSSTYYDGIMCYYYSDLYTENSGESPTPVITGYSRPVTLTGQNAKALLVLSEKSGDCPYSATEDNWDFNEAITGKECVMAQGAVGTDNASSTIVVSGTFKVFTSGYLGSQYGNRAYFTTMLADLNHRTVSNISVAEKVITEYDLNIDKQTAFNLGFVTYAFIPIVILGIGFIVFLVRRNK